MSTLETLCVSNQTANLDSTDRISIIPSRTTGLYVPPAKLRLLHASLTDKSTVEYQRVAWEALKKTINGHVNKVNTSNLPIIIRELFKHNIIRGRGLLARVIIQAQRASTFYTPVYAALVSGINAKFPLIGELICKLLIPSFRRTYERNDKNNCSATIKFLAHLINQNILHAIIALQILLLLLENPSDVSVELSVGFLKECGQKLSQVSPRGLDSVFSTLRNILDESSLDKHTQDMIDGLFTIRKDQFKSHPAIQSDLDLVDENDQHTHILQLDDIFDSETMIDVFTYDEQYEVNEEKYKQIRKTILDENSDDEDKSNFNSVDSDEEDDGKKDDDDQDSQQQTRIDQTETNLVTFRRTIYLTIQSSITAEECADKLFKMNLDYRQKMELSRIIVDSCAQQRTYEPFFGLLGQHLCLLEKGYLNCFVNVFRDQYIIISDLENVKLRNMAKFFAHLLATDSISWGLFKYIHLTEKDIRSSWVYIKNLLLGLFEFLGFTELKNRLTDPTLINFYEGLFPRHNPKDARFSINFFTSIGLGRITDELREFIISNPTPAPPPLTAIPMTIKKEDDYQIHRRYEENQRKKKNRQRHMI